MITKEQIEELGFTYKQSLINNNKDFVNIEIKTTISLSIDGEVDIIFDNYSKNWSNIDSTARLTDIIEEIKKIISY